MTSTDKILAAYRGVKVIVTGASGFIGRWVSRYLTKAEADLYLISNNLKELQIVYESYSLSGKMSEADLSTSSACKEIIDSIQPHITFNLAGYGVASSERDEDKSWIINDRMVGFMAENLNNTKNSGWSGLKLVHVGSAAEYGNIGEVIREDTAPNPDTLYGKSKLAGTKRLQNFCVRTGFPAVTARLFTVYGPGEYPYRLLPSLLRAAENRQSLALTKGEQKRDFTYVEDIAEGLLRLGLLNYAKGEPVNLGTGKMNTVRDFALCASSVLGFPDNLLEFGKVPYRDHEFWQGPPSINCLTKMIGWQPLTTMSEGIKKAADLKKNSEMKFEKLY